MFNRVVLLAVLTLAVSLLATLPGRTATGAAGTSTLDLAASVSSAIDLYDLGDSTVQPGTGEATISAPDDECCKKGLVNPFLSCAPDCPMIPSQVSAPSLDVSKIKSLARGPLVSGLPSGGIYRPPILVS